MLPGAERASGRSVTENTIWGKVVASPESGPWCVLWSKVPWLVPTPKGVPECELTTWVVCFDADSSLIYETFFLV